MSEIKEGFEVSEEIDGENLLFCCQSCAGVYRILHNSGLDEFYERRRGWKPGPPDDSKIDPALFTEYIKGPPGEREIDITISGIRCASCIWLIEHYLKKDPSILDIRINYATHRAKIKWNDQQLSLEALLNRIKSIGYTPRPGVYSEYQEGLEKEKRDLLIRFGTSAFFSMQLMLYSVALYAGYFQGIEPIYKRVFQFIAWALATPVILYGGAPFIRNTISSLKQKSINMDLLIILGSGAAYLYSIFLLFKGKEVFFDTSAMIITLILLGRFLEASARKKAGESLQKLIELQPTNARVLGNEGKARTVPASVVETGRLIDVHAGEKIPLDGVVLEGQAEVDESMLTGESKPVRKKTQDEVFAGTLNLNGRLTVKVTRTLKESLLSQIIDAVQEAQSRKAPVQGMADRVVGWLVPAILSISILTFFYWYLTAGSLNVSFMNAISILVVACPCALGLATPLAILIGSLRASTKGILIKGGDILEQAAKADILFIDKTGTLTVGKPSVTDIKTFIDKELLLRLICAAERPSGHSIGEAILNLCSGQNHQPSEFQVVSGRGVKAIVDGNTVLIGNRALMKANSIEIADQFQEYEERLSSQGKTVVFVAINGKLSGILAVVDYLKLDASETIKSIKAMGIETVMLTGDNSVVANFIGREAGIDRIFAELNPLQKAKKVKEAKAKGRVTMMAGDGINDAPSLTEADVGIAVGRATDVALESADIVIMKKELKGLTELISISKITLKIIKQNLFWAFSYNLVAIPLAVSGMLHPIVSALSMAISSLVVVTNSLRLLRY